MTTRRQFVLKSIPAVLAFAAAPQAIAQTARVEESDPVAVSLGYKHNATKVDKKKFAKYKPGQVCSNCQLFMAKAGEPWGACPALGGKLVNAKGWCSAWVAKA